MISLDSDYAAFTSVRVSSLFKSSDPEGEPFGLNTPLFYLDPLEFERHLEQTPPTLWPREFRRAAAFIREAGEKYADWNHTDEPAGDVLAASMVCLHTLAQDYAPEIAGEFTPTACAKILHTGRTPDKLAMVFAALRKAGYLDETNQPTLTAAADRAFMAKEVAELVGVDTWAKTFARPWGVKNPRQSLNQVEGITANRRGIKKALAAAVRDNVVLRETASGKDLLKLYSLSTK